MITNGLVITSYLIILCFTESEEILLLNFYFLSEIIVIWILCMCEYTLNNVMFWWGLLYKMNQSG